MLETKIQNNSLRITCYQVQAACKSKSDSQEFHRPEKAEELGHLSCPPADGRIGAPGDDEGHDDFRGTLQASEHSQEEGAHSCPFQPQGAQGQAH